AAGGPQHRDAGRSGAGYVHVRRVAARGANGLEGQLEHRARALVGLADEDRGVELAGLGCQLLGVVDAQGAVLDPWLVDDVGDRAQLLEAGPAEGRGYKGTRSIAHEPILCRI